LLHLLTELHRLGVTDMAGRSVRDRAAEALRGIRAEDCKTWWSLMVAEALVGFGRRFDDHPLLAGFDADQRDELARACDSTRVVNLHKGELIGHPNNYWLVIAGCEQARLALGLTDDRRVYELAVAQSRRVLTQNPLTYMDDSEEGRGRYDVYTFHGPGATEDLSGLADLHEPQCAAAETLLLATAREDGGGIAWGRSGGMSVVVNLIGVGSTVLRSGHARSPRRLAGVVARAVDRYIGDGWRDDATAIHRHHRPHWYLGVGRLLERSFEDLAVMAAAAQRLREGPDVVAADACDCYPPQDTFLRFDERGSGVWCYRSRSHGGLAFQLPLVDGFTSDYAAAPVWPGRFEQVCDRGMPAGVPVVEMAGKRWLPLHRPVDVRYEPGRLTWRTPCWTHMVDWDWWKGSEDAPGERQVTVRVEGEGLLVDEQWTFESPPDAVGLWLAESNTPLHVDWDCPHPHQASTIVVDGMHDWYSHEHRIRQVHQIDIEPATAMRVRYRLAVAG